MTPISQFVYSYIPSASPVALDPRRKKRHILNSDRRAIRKSINGTRYVYGADDELNSVALDERDINNS